jgi:hypothetical protein
MYASVHKRVASRVRRAGAASGRPGVQEKLSQQAGEEATLEIEQQGANGSDASI